MSTVVRALLALALSLHPSAATADVPLRDYAHTAWTHHDGMPLGLVTAILQTNDRYLWLLSREHGLLRFDGMRFVAPATPCEEQVTTLVAAPDGGFWAICGAKLIRRTPAGRIVEIPQTFLPARPAPGDWLILDRTGRPWIFGASVRSFDPNGTGLREAPRPTAGPIRAVAVDSDGAFWVSDTRRVMRLDTPQPETFALAPVWCVVRARGEGVFAVTPDRIWRLRKGAPPVAIESDAAVRFGGADDCVAEAADGGLWIGTRQHGVALAKNGGFESLADADSLDGLVSAVFIDREENVWIGASKGLHRFRKATVQPLPALQRALSGRPAFAFIDSHENLWTGPSPNGGVSRTHPDGRSVVEIAARRHAYWAIGEDAIGRIWLSDTQNIGYVMNDVFVPVQDAANAPIAGVASFKPDRRGQLWAIASDKGLYRVAPGTPRLEIASPRAAEDFVISERLGAWIALSTGGVEQHVDGRTTVHPDDQPDVIDSVPRAMTDDGDSIWVTTRRGLRRWRGGVWTTWTREHGLPGTGSTEEVVVDRTGDLWLLTTRGLLRVPRAQFDSTPDGAPGRLSFARVGVTDGVLPMGGGAVSSPRSAVDRRGRLVFTTLDSVIAVDPSDVAQAAVAPPIMLEAVTVDHQAVDVAAGGRFVEPALLQFDYTALSLRSPEYSRFRYRLEGRDPDWTDAGSQRRATYGTLPPGSYRFRVIGAGAEGVWNDEGASFAFEVRPVFWRTWWFRLSIMAGVALLIGTAYQLRVRQISRRFAAALDARVSERTRIARELHDTLLQTFQGVLIHFQAAANLLPARPDDAKHKLGAVLDHAARAITEAREAVHELRSGDGDALEDAIAVLGQQLASEPGTNAPPAIRVQVEGPTHRLRPVLRDEVYRIAGEALRNAVRHARAQTIQIDIQYGDGALRVSVRDDGSGMTADRANHAVDGHWGLAGMRERATLIGAALEFRTRPGSGTEVDLSVPATTAYQR